MPLPKALRRLTPDGLRDNVRLRAFGVGTGLIPPRTMHAPEESALLRDLARDAERVVEVGVYEGSSALQLIEVMGPRQHLHLIDPFGLQPGALREGHAATEWATLRVTEKAAKRGGPHLHWHVATSAEAERGWGATPVDLVFIDGDHLEEMARLDWDLWHRHVPVGGHVLFHDSREDQGRGLPGPTAVVKALFEGRDAIDGWSVATVAGSITAVRRDT